MFGLEDLPTISRFSTYFFETWCNDEHLSPTSSLSFPFSTRSQQLLLCLTSWGAPRNIGQTMPPMLSGPKIEPSLTRSRPGLQVSGPGMLSNQHHVRFPCTLNYQKTEKPQQNQPLCPLLPIFRNSIFLRSFDQVLSINHIWMASQWPSTLCHQSPIPHKKYNKHSFWEVYICTYTCVYMRIHIAM